MSTGTTIVNDATAYGLASQVKTFNDQFNSATQKSADMGNLIGKLTSDNTTMTSDNVTLRVSLAARIDALISASMSSADIAIDSQVVDQSALIKNNEIQITSNVSQIARYQTIKNIADAKVTASATQLATIRSQLASRMDTLRV
jgi:hypothetical protein